MSQHDQIIVLLSKKAIIKKSIFLGNLSKGWDPLPVYKDEDSTYSGQSKITYVGIDICTTQGLLVGVFP